MWKKAPEYILIDSLNYNGISNACLYRGKKAYFGVILEIMKKMLEDLYT